MITTLVKRTCYPLISFCLAVFLSSLFWPAQPVADTGATIPATAQPAHNLPLVERLRIADDVAYAPFVFLGADDRPAGITVDIWKLWSSKTGIPVDFELMQWSNALAVVRNGTADVVGALFKTEERQEHFGFTTSFYSIATTIFFHEQIHGIRGITDLRGFPIGIVKGDSAEAFIKARYPQAQLVHYPSAEALIEAAVGAEIKVFVADAPVARFYLAKHDREGVFREALRPVATNPLHAAVRKDNKALPTVVEEGFSRISQDEINDIVAAWSGTKKATSISWTTVRLVAVIIASLLSLILLWNFHLRRTVAKALQQVEQRDRELQDSEIRMKTFFDLAPFSCVVTDLQGRFRMVNKVFCSRIGQRAEDVLGRTGEEVGLFLNQSISEDIFSELKRTGAVTHREILFNSSEGPRYALYSSRLMELDGEKLILSSAVDITDRKQAEAALRESEERFFKAFALSPAPMVISDIRTGRFIDVNEQWLRMLEHTREETIGRTSYEQGIWEDPDIRTRLGQRLRQEGSFRDEPIRFITRSGKIRDALWSAETVNLGGSEVMLSLIYDFTERKKAEDALRESESYNKMLFHDSHIPLAVLDPMSHQFIDCNLAALRIYGLSDDSELLGKSPEHVSAPEQYDGRLSEIVAAERIQQALEQGEILFEWRHQRPSGAYWDAEVHLVPFTHQSRKLMQLSLQDITGRKQAESEREKMQHQLLQSQKMESIGRLAGGVAHDFNNMLSVILGHVELAMQSMDQDQPLYPRLLNIRKAAERSAALTGQLLAFARKQTVAPKVLNLNETVAGMLKMLRRLIGENIDLSWIPGANTGAIKMDPSQLDQILVNLCVNARDAIRDTGSITIETGVASLDEDFCAAIPGAKPGEYARLAVSDNGCGMDAATLAHLFEPFFTTKKMGEGTGLGLATIYGIVRQNKGFINVYSEPERGTTFRIYLPHHTAMVEEQPRATTVDSPAAQGTETILLVEDEPMILDIASNMLKLQGYTILPASSPGEAIRLAREQDGALHLLITDVVMPEMNGQDLAKKLLALFPELKLLFMSGYTANVIAQHGVLDEGVHFLQKPFVLKDLAAKVREALDTKKAVRSR
ncbi:PAS domain S-box protein [Desulfobulbus alkaliphilus]|uniref:PAS domain S-box protein n=1 Tax=Desulfobulbus alkaliphilus TaxID=869814 RepID=UPI0019659C23|nr:PAS domain S-box protein [Desulfobulbus alkaliphilus]MBM9536633.1 transporter substrate-binding domain-containing protein [Desulfobulbus alkaliphilus]